MFKGVLDNSTVDEEWTKPPPTETAQLVLDNKKPPLHTLINSYDFEEVAARTASKKTWAFYSSAANDLITRNANKSMFRRIWFRPRVMRDMRFVDTSSKILGIKTSFPLFIAPTGMAKLIHPEGETALARAAKEKGILHMVSPSKYLRFIAYMNHRYPQVQAILLKKSWRQHQIIRSYSNYT
jgi:L-lactate dehydrogenase (cytochrome)